MSSWDRAPASDERCAAGGSWGCDAAAPRSLGDAARAAGAPAPLLPAALSLAVAL
jgi:hypothetical protein